MNYNSSENDFEIFLKNKHIEFIEFEFEYDNRDRFRGICYITLDKTNAEKLIEFNGTVFKKFWLIIITIIRNSVEET